MPVVSVLSDHPRAPAEALEHTEVPGLPLMPTHLALLPLALLPARRCPASTVLGSKRVEERVGGGSTLHMGDEQGQKRKQAAIFSESDSVRTACRWA